ncbi:hemolysin III family protein [Thiomicrorhabdus hydrogeniphila]
MFKVHPPETALNRLQTLGEEIANSLSHGFGLLAIIIGTPFLIVHAAHSPHTGYLVGVCIFTASMILLYLGSTLYHAVPNGRLKNAFQVVDHSMIFILIAGTYTPFTLGVLYGGWGWTLFGITWGLATLGILLKIFGGAMNRPIFDNVLYLVMGWIIVIAIEPLLANLSSIGLFWLVAGGISYSLGIVFYLTDTRLAYGHFLWHLFVLGGSISHFFAVWYAIPA